MSENEKKNNSFKFRLNPLDIAFVLFIAVVIVFSLVRSDSWKNISWPSETCEIELVAENLDALIDDTYNDKDIFFESGLKLGTVKNSKIYTETGNSESAAGSSALIINENDRKTTLTLTVEATLKCKDGKYYSSEGNLVISGADFVLHGKAFSLNCVVKSINSVKK